MSERRSSVRVNDGCSFPAGGLVDVARVTYQSTPLTVTKIRPQVFCLVGAGGTVAAVGASQGCAIIDTGYGPRVGEIRSAIVLSLQESPRWLINTHWHFDHTDGNSTFTGDGTTIVAHTNCRARLSQDQYVPSLEWRVSASATPHGPC